MPFARDRQSVPVVVVAIGLSPLQMEQLETAAGVLRIAINKDLPPSGDYIVVTGKDCQKPQLPVHIPLIDAADPDLIHRLQEALLYLEAHRHIKR